MDAPIRTKSFLATKAYPLEMDELVATGAVLETVQMCASLTDPYPLQPTTLNQPVVIGAGTVSLNANPGEGALLIIEPGTGNEEKLKVISITGSAPWVCTIKPTAWADHASSAPVSYEPGRNTRLFVDSTPTPSGTLVVPFLQKGVHNMNYRVSYLAHSNDNQDVEDEFRLEVRDRPSSGTNIKQPSETRDLAADFTKALEEPHQAGATLSSGTAYVSSATSTGTAQLAAQANPGVGTITLNTHPGVGAMLVLTPAALLTSNNPPERVYVTGVSGSGPTYTVTILPDLEFTHVNGADVTVFRGFTQAFLVSPTSTFFGLTAVNRARGGQAGRVLQVAWLVTTSQTEVHHANALVSLEEI
jgi:hypothetical protein